MMGMLLRYIAIAAPKQIEYVPMSLVEMRSHSHHAVSAQAFRAFAIIFAVMCSIQLLFQKAETRVFSEEPGY